MKLINTRRFKCVVSLLSICCLLLLSGSVYAVDKKKTDEENTKPQVYPFTDDEPICPSGHCDRSNENPKDNDD